MTEHEFLVNLRRILLSAIALIDERLVHLINFDAQYETVIVKRAEESDE